VGSLSINRQATNAQTEENDAPSSQSESQNSKYMARNFKCEKKNSSMTAKAFINKNLYSNMDI